MYPAHPCVVAVDVGGTCTDCVVYRAGEPVRLGKAFSTPPEFAAGVLDAVADAAAGLGLSAKALLARTRLFLHGSTVVDNAILTRSGARTGLVTTVGFEDTLAMTRGAYGRWSGQPEDVIKHPVATNRPAPLVPQARIAGVRERVDYKGAVITPLDEAQARAAISDLVARERIEALAICLLWAFRNPAHEQRLRAIAHEIAPELHVSISSDIAPVPGEYERTSTTVIDAYAGAITRRYLSDLTHRLVQIGYRGELLVMQGNGGLASVAMSRAVGMIECGPAAGMIAAQFIGRETGDANIIATDMGGTTFKVGVIQAGELAYAREPIVDRFHYAAPKLDVVSIGAGGGSIVAVDARTRRPLVGPASAGAVPGPICYGRGGTEPTLTDVAALIGYMHPDTFLGGRVHLDIERARELFAAKVAAPLGMPVEEAAIGIYQVAAARIADSVREVTIERGLDPRDFVIHSFGGAGGLFTAAVAKELGVARVLVPFTASVNCAFGMVAADVVQEFSIVQPMAAPPAPAAIDTILGPLEAQGRARLAEAGFAPAQCALDWAVELRFRRQVHQVRTPLRRGPPLDAATLETLVTDFEALYEQRYGKGSAFRAAGVELVSFHLRARGVVEPPRFTQSEVRLHQAAPVGERRMYVDTRGTMASAPIYDFERLAPGSTLAGPAVIHTPITTIVVHGAQRAQLDAYRNVLITSSRK